MGVEVAMMLAMVVLSLVFQVMKKKKMKVGMLKQYLLRKKKLKNKTRDR